MEKRWKRLFVLGTLCFARRNPYFGGPGDLRMSSSQNGNAQNDNT